MDTARNLSVLLSEQAEAVKERDAMAAKPLGYVHGVLERIRQEVGAEATLTMALDGSGKLLATLKTPKGVAKMEMAAQDYEASADRLAVDVRSVCDHQRITQPTEPR
jgi:hypothetical protein